MNPLDVAWSVLKQESEMIDTSNLTNALLAAGLADETFQKPDYVPLSHVKEGDDYQYWLSRQMAPALGRRSQRELDHLTDEHFARRYYATPQEKPITKPRVPPVPYKGNPLNRYGDLRAKNRAYSQRRANQKFIDAQQEAHPTMLSAYEMQQMIDNA